MFSSLLHSLRNLGPRDRAVVRVFLITLALNLLVAGCKITIGLLSGRITIVADGLHGLLDSANNVLGIAAIGIAAKPPDDDHPYGHRKFENVAALAIGGMIVLIAWEILDNILRTLWRIGVKGEAPPEATPFDPLFAAILVASVGVNLAVAAYEKRRGQALQSSLLVADAGHTSSDAVATVLSLLSLLLAPLGWWVDPLLAVGVLVFLARAATGIIRENLPAFTDQVHLDPAEVRRASLEVDGILDALDIRSHGTAGDVHLDLVIVIRGDQSAARAEQLEEDLRSHLRAAFPGLTLVSVHHRTRDSGS